MIYFFSDISLFLFFVSFLIYKRRFIHDTYCDSTCILAHYYSCCNIIQRCINQYLIFTLIVLFPPHKISSLVSIFATFVSLSLLLMYVEHLLIPSIWFDCITHWFYCSWVIYFGAIYHPRTIEPMCDTIKPNGRNQRRCYTYIKRRESDTNVANMGTRLDIL